MVVGLRPGLVVLDQAHEQALAPAYCSDLGLVRHTLGLQSVVRLVL